MKFPFSFHVILQAAGIMFQSKQTFTASWAPSWIVTRLQLSLLLLFQPTPRKLSSTMHAHRMCQMSPMGFISRDAGIHPATSLDPVSTAF